MGQSSAATRGLALAGRERQRRGRLLVGYLIAAIRQLFPEACPDTEALIHAALVPQPETLVSVLTNEIDDLPDRFVLVLDDYHLITEPALHQLFDQLLQHLPLQLHLLLTSRSDPPLALPRLRANRALNELRSADLRFSPQETDVFLAQTVGVERSAPLADVLMKHTEGWVAGLQLAALSLRAAPDALALAEDLLRHTIVILQTIFSNRFGSARRRAFKRS